MKTIRVTIERELLERIDAHVQRLGTTRAAFAREALLEALTRREEQGVEERHAAG